MRRASVTTTYWCHKHGSGACGCLGGRVWINGVEVSSTTRATLVTPEYLCPDLLRYEQIGAADNLRGRVVRAFFWAMRAWPTKEQTS